MQEGKLSCDPPHEPRAAAAVDPRGFALAGAIAAHAAPVSCLALHPSLPMVVTGALWGHAQGSVSIPHGEVHRAIRKPRRSIMGNWLVLLLTQSVIP